jgi:uncharacterized protein (TIGR03437 family)
LAVTWLLCGPGGLSPWLAGQTVQLGVPAIAAVVKGPDQINLVWAAVPNPGYGYLVEIQSAGDNRYAAWQELEPIPPAAGYQCDSTVQFRGAACTIGDPAGVHVYAPPTNGVPYWVTEPTYIDPQDGSAAQFIAWGLKPDTSYSFRVRTYSGSASPTYGAYSNTATAAASNYVARYVSPTGNDANDGTVQDDTHAWRTLSHATGAIGCGQVLIVKGGNYPADRIGMSRNCSAGNKAVVLVNPGDTAAITSGLPGADNTVGLTGSYAVVDGIVSAASPAGDYAIVLGGHHNALLNVEAHPPVIPTQKNGVNLVGDHNLVYHSYLHDAFSPDATQNPSGNNGWVLTVQGGGAVWNVIWGNHLTRGGHDVSLCKSGCSYNRWLNNIMDGGWGMAFEAIESSQFNLIEGNFVKDVGQLVAFYKPAFELSDANNTVRRNISVNAKSNGLEISALEGGSSAVNELVYNNVFYSPGSCIFQSQNGSVASYDGDIYANNICYKLSGNATDIYQANKNGKIMYNDILSTDAAGNPLPDKSIFIWNHGAQADFQYPKTLAYAEQNYSPPFSHNNGLDVPPQFVDEAHFDFHLSPGSPLTGAGTSMVDPQWGATVGTTDLGAFGIASVSSTAVPGAPLSIDTTSLAAFLVGTPYSQTMVASGGAAPYQAWVVTAGNMPPGIALSSAGVLSGMPTTPGSFSFTVQVADAAGNTATQPFTVTIASGSPAISATGVVNGASFAGGAVAPGEILAIFGSAIGPGTAAGLQLDRAGYVTNLLAGTQVTFDGVPSPLIFVQAGQVSAIAPYGLSGKNSTVVQISYQGETTNPLTLPVAATAPGIFTNDASGHGQGSILNQDGSRNSADHPAPVGSYVSVYATGEGQTNPAGADGKPGDAVSRLPLQPVTATIGGVSAPVQYAGGVFGLTAGILQVNLQVPPGVTPGGAVPVVLTIGGVSAPGVTMAVR